MYCVISIVCNKAYIYSAHDLFEFIPHMLSKWHESKLHSWHACQSVCIWMCNIWKLAMLHSCSIHHCSYNVFRCTVRRRSQGIGYSTLIPHALLILQYLTSYMLILHISTRLITQYRSGTMVSWSFGDVIPGTGLIKNVTNRLRAVADFLSWFLISHQHSSKPIRNFVGKWLSVWSDVNKRFR